MFNLKGFFYPHNKFTTTVLKIVDSEEPVKLSDIYRELGYKTNLGKLVFYLRRLEAGEYLSVSLSNSNHTVYSLSQKGKDLLKGNLNGRP